MGETAPRRRGAGIRVRTTAAAVLVVGVVLVLGSLAMLAFVERSLVAQVADAAELRAQDIAASGEVDAAADPQEEFVQLLRDGEVVASSPNVEASVRSRPPVPRSTSSCGTCRSPTRPS